MLLTKEVQIVLFKPEGRIDLQGGMVLSAKMTEVEPQPNQLWIIDLLAVDFMDSSGLFSLVKGLKVAQQSGCRLVICNLQASVRLVLELTQLDSVFEIFHTYEDVLMTLDNKSMTSAH
ncbi:STAS domain-containing protein [Calothrix rhizosoleniae]|uniref:STAS domain-containing protein n=1 Tax=Calothrix rhizosoleniae TaxID=888997 RepID=UPI000B49C406|nr:STAS domain-containing protein [Calothrix rhizosoleniae]